MTELKGISVRRAAIAAGLASMAFGLAACGGSVPGNPGPASTPTGGPTGANSTTTTAPPSATVEPCKLLGASDLQQLQITAPGQSKTTGGQPTCDWQTSSAIVSVSLLGKLGIADLVVTGEVKDVPIGSHQARQMRDSSGGCLIAIGITTKSRADVLVDDTRGDQDKACTLAGQAAALIEPNLPKS